MSKHKKKKDKHSKKEKHSSSEDNTQRVLSVIRSIGEEANLKKIFPKLEKKLNQEDIILALNELDRNEVIRIEQKGRIKILEDSKSKATGDKQGRFYFGTVDITRNGAAFVTVEGIDKDVYIAQRSVGNAMQGDEVKIRITSFRGRPEGEIVGIIKHAQDSFTGRIDVLKNLPFLLLTKEN